MNYNPNNLTYKPIFTQEETKRLDDFNKTLSLEKFLSTQNLIDKFGFDFVYTSAKIEGNTYTKADALTLLDYGRTAGGKRYSEAKEEYIPIYVGSILEYYEQGTYEQSKEFFVKSYQFVAEFMREQ